MSHLEKRGVGRVRFVPIQYFVDPFAEGEEGGGTGTVGLNLQVLQCRWTSHHTLDEEEGKR
jgi:hypothetical protein